MEIDLRIKALVLFCTVFSVFALFLSQANDFVFKIVAAFVIAYYVAELAAEHYVNGVLFGDQEDEEAID